MKTIKPYMILFISVIVFFTFYFINYQDSKITIGDPLSLNHGWTYQDEMIDLPTHVHVPKGQAYTITQTLDESFHEPQILMIRSSLQDVVVMVDDTIVYQKIYGESIDQPYASMWHFIKLPRHIDGQVLSITFSSPYQDMSGLINPVYYGTEVMHYTYLVRTHGLRLLIGFMMLIIGIVVMVSNFFIDKKQDKGFIHLGLFSFLISLWIIAESRMLQFFTGSELLIGTLAYLTLPLFMIPVLMYIENYMLVLNKTFIKPFKYVFITHFIVITCLHFFSVVDFFETVFVTQIFIVLSIITALVLLIVDIKKAQNQRALKFLKTTIILVVFAALELIAFMFNDFQSTANYLSIGLLIVMIGMFVNYFKFLISRLKLSYEAEIYEKLAFMDHVTQGNNRLAFERDLDAIYQSEEKKKHLRLVIFDLDNLKKINDQYGHVEGDRAIKKAFYIISDIFKDKGICYRIGGDEFACILETEDHAYYETKKQALINELDVSEKETPYHFGLSFGSSTIHQETMSPQTLINLADQDMYINKKRA